MSFNKHFYIILFLQLLDMIVHRVCMWLCVCVCVIKIALELHNAEIFEIFSCTHLTRTLTSNKI